ncbi:MarR family transcriptional regulator [Nocardia yunnanensis]|nr:MarR family transcriptional regulator [Nocardia yunnanensis]
MTQAEMAVLAALHPDHSLTAPQIQRAAALTAHRTRTAIAALTSRGLIAPTHPQSRYRITPRGRAALTTKTPRFT